MKTQIKQWGDSKVLVLSSDFMNFYKAKVGDWVDISDSIIVGPETRERRAGMQLEMLKDKFPDAYKWHMENMEAKE